MLGDDPIAAGTKLQPVNALPAAASIAVPKFNGTVLFAVLPIGSLPSGSFKV